MGERFVALALADKKNNKEEDRTWYYRTNFPKMHSNYADVDIFVPAGTDLAKKQIAHFEMYSGMF